jgi:calcium/calmodulin-dependent protein kinase I
LGFVAPEILAQNGLLDCQELADQEDYTIAVDLWSVGEILFRALTHKAPFNRRLTSYVKGELPFPKHILESYGVTEKGYDMVKSLLMPMPNDRPAAREALAHSWFALQTQSSPRVSEDMAR